MSDSQISRARISGSKLDRDGKTWAQEKIEVQRALSKMTALLAKSGQNAASNPTRPK